jgi:hypothetical protein
VGRKAEHINVGSGAKNAILGAGNDNRTNLGMFESNVLQSIVQLDIYSEIVRIQFQFISRADSAVLGDIHRQRRYRAVEGETPMLVPRRIGLKIDRFGFSL